MISYGAWLLRGHPHGTLTPTASLSCALLFCASRRRLGPCCCNAQKPCKGNGAQAGSQKAAAFSASPRRFMCN